MPLLGALAATGLMFYSDYVYDQARTDTSYLVTNLYIISALILCGVLRRK